MIDAPIKLRCTKTSKLYNLETTEFLSDDGGLFEVDIDLERIPKLDEFDNRLLSRRAVDRSGVWRFRELILPIPEDLMFCRGEGNTNLYQHEELNNFTMGADVQLKHEGENPTGSFKDRGMTTAISMARLMGFKAVACASTGNTSASMASYARMSGLLPIVFIPDGKISTGKLSQALAYGALTLQVQGNFDDALEMVQKVCVELGIYLMNSLNPYRIEGQKAILIEALQQRGWVVPDWIVLPGGNLGNTSAVGKALDELRRCGLINKAPRVAVIQAAGANPFYSMYKNGENELTPMQPETFATAIRIGNPVSWAKAVRVLNNYNGVVLELSEQEIAEAKWQIDRSGIGAEPASCCTLGGIRKLRELGFMEQGEDVLGILTGHVLKDSDSNIFVHTELQSRSPSAPVKIPAKPEAITKLISKYLNQ